MCSPSVAVLRFVRFERSLLLKQRRLQLLSPQSKNAT